jgi:uncharacterized membrane protein
MKWEYKILCLEGEKFDIDKLVIKLNNLGEQGWELTLKLPSLDEGWSRLIFKRPKPE